LLQPEKVSVIIALYNAEKFIADTLFSVTNQTWKNIEIIVVNDGSKDASREVVERLDIPNLNLYNRENKGQCAASNYGISKSSGELIKFLDADDILAHDCIEKMILKWREKPNRLVFGQWHYFVNDINHVKYNYSPLYKDFHNELDWYAKTINSSEAMLAGWMWLIPKTILSNAGGWDERLHLMNDFEFSTRLILNSDGIAFAESAKHFYRKGLENAMTSSMNEKIALSIFTGIKEAMGIILKKENSNRMRKGFAYQFQKWVFQFYPNQKTITKKMKLIIIDLGGCEVKPEGGMLFKLLNTILPWTWVKQLQYIMYKTVWNPVLKYKQRVKFKNFTK
tara:strand:+ start:3940 stop:4950 length:1011 start_codon:yes stop_codon:yes gene_type:complete